MALAPRGTAQGVLLNAGCGAVGGSSSPCVRRKWCHRGEPSCEPSCVCRAQWTGGLGAEPGAGLCF